MRQLVSVLFLALALSAPVSAIEKFSDMPDDFWAARSVYNVVRLGITKGYPDGTFRGTQKIERYELMVFLSNLAIAMERMMDEKLSMNTEVTRNARYTPGMVNNRVLEELRADIEVLKAAILKEDGQPTRGRPVARGPWKINGGFTFRYQNQASTTYILPRAQLQLLGEFGKSGFLVDLDTNYVNLNSGSVFQNVTNNVLAFKGFSRAEVGPGSSVFVEASTGPADQLINDFYTLGAAMRQKIAYRPGNAFKIGADLSGFLISHQYEKRRGVASSVDRNTFTLGYYFDPKRRTGLSGSVDTYQGVLATAQNNRQLFDVGVGISDDFRVYYQTVLESTAPGNDQNQYSLGLEFKTLQTQVKLQNAAASAAFGNGALGEFVHQVNAQGYRVINGDEWSLYARQKIEQFFLGAGGSSFSNGTTQTSGTHYNFEAGIVFDQFASLGFDYSVTDHKANNIPQAQQARFQANWQVIF